MPLPVQAYWPRRLRAPSLPLSHVPEPRPIGRGRSSLPGQKQNGRQHPLPAVHHPYPSSLPDRGLCISPGLPMSAAAMSATTTVESTTAATVESAASTMDRATTMETASRAAVEAASRTACKATSAGKAASTVKTSSTDESASAPPASTPAATPTTPTPRASPAIPRPGANKHSARKPIRPVVAVRRASVRCVVVIPVLAYRRSANISVSRSISHTHADLRLRIRQRQHQSTYQRQIFQVTHGDPPFSDPPLQPQTNRTCRPPRCYINLQRLCI